MTNYKLLQAYSRLIAISQIRLKDCKKSFKIYKNIQSIKTVVEFIESEQKKLLEAYGGEIDDKNNIIFGASEDARERADKWNKENNILYNTEVELTIEPVIISLDELGELSLAPVDFELLSGIINFE